MGWIVPHIRVMPAWNEVHLSTMHRFLHQIYCFPKIRIDIFMKHHDYSA